MNDTATYRAPSAAPDPGVKMVTVDVETLSAAFKLSYLAGAGDRDRAIRALTMIHRTCGNMRRSMRRAKPTPQAGVEAGLDLIAAAAEHALQGDGPPSLWQ